MKSKLTCRTSVSLKAAKTLRVGLSVSVAALALGFGAAFAGTVNFWSPFTGPDGATIEKMISDFNAGAGKEQDVEVNLLIVPWAQYYTKLTVAMASGSGPDLSIAHSHRIPGFAAEGALAPFTSDELAAAGISGDEYIPVLWNAGEVDDERFAVPIDAFPRHLYYNKDLFEKAGLDPETPPSTLAEFRDAATKINALGDDVYGAIFRLGGGWTPRDFYAIYWQFQADLLNEERTGVSDGFEAAAGKTLEITNGLVTDGLAPSQDVERYEALFVGGRAGMALSQITELPLFRDTEGLNYGVAAFPTFGDNAATFALGHNFILSRGLDEDVKDDALTFIKWFNDHSLDWAAGGKIPASKIVLASDGFAALSDQSKIAESVSFMKLPPVIAEQPQIDRVIQEQVEAVYGGSTSIEDAVKAMSSGINEILAD